MKPLIIPAKNEKKQPRYSAKEIKRAFKVVGIKQKTIAIEMGVSPTMLTRAIKGQVKSFAIAKAICTRTCLDINRFWPDLYKKVDKKKKEEVVFKRRKDDRLEHSVKQGFNS